VPARRNMQLAVDQRAQGRAQVEPQQLCSGHYGMRIAVGSRALRAVTSAISRQATGR
jgi:hypothetical protein